ncbi:MAG: tetratricopeptide repeat protein [Kiritimatiellales bacterium]|nr:tetratricopeptide repeat protein [Kiritimatiellales bacterium]
MKNKKLVMMSGGLCLLFALFLGCGERSGEKEYSKAMDSWRSGDLVRARTLLEKSIRKLSGNEKKSEAYNQLGIILWQLQESDASIEAFGKSCGLTDEMSGANLNLGLALFQAGRTDEAEVALNNVLGAEPGNATARATIGLIEMRKKNWSKAAQETTAAVRTQPRDPAGQNALALAELHANRNTEAAIARLKQILSANPGYAPAAYNLAVVYDQWLGNKSAAQGWYNQYIQKAGTDGSHVKAAQSAIARLAGNAPAIRPSTNPDDAARYIAEGTTLHTAKKYSEAVAQYEKAIQADPSQKNAYYNMGLSYYELKKYPDAARACQDALKLDPGFANARYMLALAYVQQRSWADAEREAKTLGKTDTARAEGLLKYISDIRKR